MFEVPAEKDIVVAAAFAVEVVAVAPSIAVVDMPDTGWGWEKKI